MKERGRHSKPREDRGEERGDGAAKKTCFNWQVAEKSCFQGGRNSKGKAFWLSERPRLRQGTS